MKVNSIDSFLRDKLHEIYSVREIGSIADRVAGHLTGFDRTQVHLNRDLDLTTEQTARLNEIAGRLAKHEPIQYILGETEFYGLKLMVRPGVLIPRGETEELVEWIIKAEGTRHKAQGKAEGKRQKAEGKMKDLSDKIEGRQGDLRSAVGRPPSAVDPSVIGHPSSVDSSVVGRPRSVVILDIGTGSGAIAIALAKHLPNAKVYAADISDEALSVTRENTNLNRVHIETLNLDILNPLSLTCALSPEPSAFPSCPPALLPSALFSIIVSNPPYIPLAEKTAMGRNVVGYEPPIALFAPDEDPLVFYRAIIRFAGQYLEPSGRIYVEIHHPLADETVGLFRKHFPEVELRQDIHGRNRMICAHR